ncbi:hypothetical protein [Natrialbaceae archaeon AArc-T1-2]|uniref:hypothetical protein n=1 Tax=Natrialbaceae archaeon AArc-T1-2 TaxID=3053904 RepID=UPI00255A7E24|nr:hypothetical protein [Natrialbaceae archaeon AArc-T1-2]WIV67588.1 hypothetical protein QQ977_02325 [Natrialbaceae archaeon AArc-T1-2]
MSDEPAGLESILEDANARLSAVDDYLENVESLDSIADELESDELEDLRDTVDVLVSLVDELEDALEAIDLAELPEAVDGDELLAAIDAGEIPDALGEGDASDVIEIRQVIQAIDLVETWNAANVSELWDAKDDLEETTDELVDETDDDSMLGEAAETVADDDSLVGDEDEELIEGDVTDAATDEFGSFDLGGDSIGMDAAETEAYQTMIQTKAMTGIEEFREALLYTHETFQKLYEYNRERTRRKDTSTNSRNPTAVSTMATGRADVGSTARSSTVPREVKGSTAPGFDRIYGRRFERELEKRRGGDGGESDGG